MCDYPLIKIKVTERKFYIKKIIFFRIKIIENIGLILIYKGSVYCNFSDILTKHCKTTPKFNNYFLDNVDSTF